MKISKTKQYYVEAHRALWGWLAENPMKEKEDWPEWIYNDGEYLYERNHCFACGFTAVLKSGVLDCENCLFVWPGEGLGHGCQLGDEDGLFDLWEIAFEHENLSELVEYAQQIRDLPVREDT